MTLNELIERLHVLGFSRVEGTPAYVGTTQFDHWMIERQSRVFVGDGPSVTYGGQMTQIPGAGAFLIANGRSEPKGMARQLLRLDSRPTGHIPDPGGRTSLDDPYWRDPTDLSRLLERMATHFD